MVEVQVKPAGVPFLILLGVALVCSILGWLLAPQEPTVEILSMVIVCCAGLALNQRSNRSYIDALLALAAASSIAAVLLTRTTMLVFRTFGLDHLAAMSGITALLYWIVPVAGAMMLLAVPQRLKDDSLGLALSIAVGLSLAASVVAFLAGSIACAALGAHYSDYGMVVHNLRAIDVTRALPLVAVSTFLASLIVFIGIRMDRVQRNQSRAVVCAVAAVVAIRMVFELWPAVPVQ